MDGIKVRAYRMAQTDAVWAVLADEERIVTFEGKGSGKLRSRIEPGTPKQGAALEARMSAKGYVFEGVRMVIDDMLVAERKPFVANHVSFVATWDFKAGAPVGAFAGLECFDIRGSQLRSAIAPGWMLDFDAGITPGAIGILGRDEINTLVAFRLAGSPGVVVTDEADQPVVARELAARLKASSLPRAALLETGVITPSLAELYLHKKRIFGEATAPEGAVS